MFDKIETIIKELKYVQSEIKILKTQEIKYKEQERRYISDAIPKEKNRTKVGRGYLLDKNNEPYEIHAGDEFFVKAQIEKNSISKQELMLTTIDIVNKYVGPDEKPKMKVRY